MLSEPRRRQKWGVNPRGNHWANGESDAISSNAITIIPLPDESKFGQKMLERMGWAKGKGLGAREQGDVELVRARPKDDNRGVGFEGHDDTWLAHQDDFSAVLADLNQAHGVEGAGADDDVADDEAKTSSLEAESKGSKKRVQ